MTEPSLPDQPARDRIAADLDTTLFVEAGAGSGKTRALVGRVLALVVSGAAELGRIAAITFTEKAGTELRDRIRAELERRALHEESAPGGDPVVAARCRAALEEVDVAAIGTLHAFAQRLLAEHPVEAGLPPRVEVLDEVSSDVEFERRWATFRDRLLADPGLERTLLLFFAAGVSHEALRSLALAFDRNWDLVGERVAPHAPDPPAVRPLLAAALAEIDGLCAERSDCRAAGDKLAARLDAIAAHADTLRELTDDVDLLEALGPDAVPPLPSFRVGNTGSKNHWPDIGGLRARVAAAGERLEAVRTEVLDACAHRLGTAIAAFTLAAAEERRGAGRLQFHDLLVLCRELLRHSDAGPAVRAHLHRRYQRILLDEFQDTDPIQIELAVRIAAADPASPESGSAPWDQVPVAPGHLFVVGDPKQSIYRFRRADIATFLAARDRLGPDGGGTVGLTANFRTVAPVIDWVNATFSSLMGERPDQALAVASQPGYVPLDAVRPDPPAGAAVAVVGRSPHPSGTRADDLRAAEAAEVAAAVAEVVTAGWSVAGDGGGDGPRWRPARLGDITILVPARTSLPFLEDALEAAGIPYRAESSSLVYATRAVRDLLMVLRAVDDPTDGLAVVCALRTPLLACGDDDLFRFKVEAGGRWNYLAPQPAADPAGDPVGAGLSYLAGLHRQRWWRAPSELAEQVVRDRRAFELGFAEGRPRDVWRRLRFVVDQARAWHDATGGTLRQYLHWVDCQTGEGGRVAESVLPETDDDAVRIMTIHAAKGLEFPVTIVSGMSTAPQGRPAPAEVAFPPDGTVGYKFGAKVTTEEFKAWVPIDEQMAYDERIRLLYVACTRARDHLVVSLTRKERRRPPSSASSRTNAELLCAGMGAERVAALPDAGAGGPLALPPPAAVTPPPPFRDWAAERAAALARGSRPGAVAATALTDEGAPDPGDEPENLAAGLHKRPPDLDLPPWLKGRYGTAVGRAVHGVLQTVDLATGAGLDAAVAAQCQAEAVPERAPDVRRLAGFALASPAVVEAAGCPHWREVYACVPVEDRLLEGYVDLLYRRPVGGLAVVDYKTAATSEASELDRRLAAYRLQGGAYAWALAGATGEPVAAVVFVFLTPDGAVERTLDGLDAAVADVRALVAAGREVTLG